MMKKNTLLTLLMFVTALLSAQDITFTFQNARITNDGTDDFYEADIYIQSTADFKLGSGQIYFNYSTAAFGENIHTSGSFEYLQPAGSILAETYSSFPAYQSFIANDNTTSRVSTSFQQGVSSGTITANNVTTIAKHLFSIKVKYVDSSHDPMVSFETGSVFLDQFFTACGPSTFGFPNCTTNPGVQLVNDTFNSTGAVVDIVSPVITLLGSTPITVEKGGPYTDAGATANDNVDGDITASIVTVSNVDIDVVGDYMVTYNVTDAAGNAATQVVRTVNVVDTTAPVITLTGANPQAIEQGDVYNELGVTTDDGSAVVIDDSSVNTSVVGSYTVTYNATDAAGNVATQVTRTVDVFADATPPVITLLGTTPVTVELGSMYTDAGATASDNFDGDITVDIVIVNNVNANVLGTYTVTYNVSDASGNDATEVVRTVNVVDTTAPVITLTGVNPQTIERTNAYTELGATTDDGSPLDIDASAVDVNIAGSYTVTYNATDASGNAATQVTRIVNVVDTTAPVITLNGANPQTIERTNVYTELGATTDDGSTVVIDVSAVDTDTVGSYRVTYNATDASGNAATQVIRTVNIVDTTAPVITLNGANPQLISVGTTYVELGATADDGSTVVIDASAVDTNTLGSYTVTYNATDASGNIATEVIRTITVEDSCPIFDLPADNFVVQAASETCEDKNNGVITITAEAAMDYVATINGDTYNFTSNVEVTDLPPGTYSVCIAIDGVPNCEQCFGVIVEEAPILDGKISLDNQHMNVEIVTGTAPYTVIINDVITGIYDSKSFVMDVQHGDNIEVFSSIGCEGKMATKVELLTDIRLYPNPTQSNVEILVPGLGNSAIQIEVRNALGTLISSKEYVLSGGKITLPMETLRAGVYFVSVGGANFKTFKVIKQ